MTIAKVMLLVSCAANAQERPPAIPLITHNPYFSIWSMADRLTDESTRHWTCAEQPIEGVALIDGKAYRFMGERPDIVPAMHQTSCIITPTSTIYEFAEAGIRLELQFFTPAIMSDLDVLSRPVTYLTWKAQATDSGTHRVSVLIDVDPVLAVNDRSELVVSSRHQTRSLNVLTVGSRTSSKRSSIRSTVGWLKLQAAFR